MDLPKKLKNPSLYTVTFWQLHNHELLLVEPRKQTAYWPDATVTPDGVCAAFELDLTSHKILRSYMPTANEVPLTVGTGG